MNDNRLVRHLIWMVIPRMYNLYCKFNSPCRFNKARAIIISQMRDERAAASIIVLQFEFLW